MGVTIETDVWEPNQALYVFILISCFLSIFCLPHLSRTPTPFDHSSLSSLLRFQRNFLLPFSISSVMEGLWSVFGEYELSYYGVSKENMVLSLCVGYAAALFFGTFLGMLSDLILFTMLVASSLPGMRNCESVAADFTIIRIKTIFFIFLDRVFSLYAIFLLPRRLHRGQKKVCLIFFILHLFVGVWKRIISHPSVWLASICLSLASYIFSFSFETWMVVEHDKQGHRQDTLNDLFWLMTFTESASFICSQVMANWLVDSNVEKHMLSPSTVAVLLAILAIIFVNQGWNEAPQTVLFKDYRISFVAYIFGDKRVWLLAWAQACAHFAIAVFWILWASTIVADGREVQLGLIYPCLLGARMLGSTAFPWFYSGPLSVRTEDCLLYVFIVMGFVLSIVAYDYQEIGVLVTLFFIFHACVGLILPSLARLRTMYIPNELRGGMICLSLAPANAAILFFLLQRGYYQNMENSTIMAFAALSLFSAAGCLYLLKRLGKQPHQNWHKL